jgi:hypothetical protein
MKAIARKIMFYLELQAILFLLMRAFQDSKALNTKTKDLVKTLAKRHKIKIIK